MCDLISGQYVKLLRDYHRNAAIRIFDIIRGECDVMVAVSRGNKWTGWDVAVLVSVKIHYLLVQTKSTVSLRQLIFNSH